MSEKFKIGDLVWVPANVCMTRGGSNPRNIIETKKPHTALVVCSEICERPNWAPERWIEVLYKGDRWFVDPNSVHQM